MGLHRHVVQSHDPNIVIYRPGDQAEVQLFSPLPWLISVKASLMLWIRSLGFFLKINLWSFCKKRTIAWEHPGRVQNHHDPKSPNHPFDCIRYLVTGHFLHWMSSNPNNHLTLATVAKWRLSSGFPSHIGYITLPKTNSKSTWKWMVGILLLMDHLIGSLSHYLQGFIHPRWCRISSINSSFLLGPGLFSGASCQFQGDISDLRNDSHLTNQGTSCFTSSWARCHEILPQRANATSACKLRRMNLSVENRCPGCTKSIYIYTIYAPCMEYLPAHLP